MHNQDSPNSTAKVKLSFILSVYNEMENLPVLVDRINNAIKALQADYELIFVDDGSEDGSNQWIRELSYRDEHVVLVEFSRNFGHEAAMKAGIDICSGDAAIIMDADLQHPPELIPEMFKLWRQGNKVVHAVRVKNFDGGFWRNFASSLFYKMFNLLSHYKIPPNATDFKLLDSDIVSYLRQMKEKYIFLRGLIAYIGFRQTTVSFQAPKRKRGRSSYSVSKLVMLAVNSIFSFSLVPLRVIQFLGLAMFLFSCIYGFAAILGSIFFETGFGFTPVLASTLFLGSVQLIVIGIIGEYIGKIHTEIKDRPPYIVHRSKINEVEK